MPPFFGLRVVFRADERLIQSKLYRPGDQMDFGARADKMHHHSNQRIELC